MLVDLWFKKLTVLLGRHENQFRNFPLVVFRVLRWHLYRVNRLSPSPMKAKEVNPRRRQKVRCRSHRRRFDFIGFQNYEGRVNWSFTKFPWLISAGRERSQEVCIASGISVVGVQSVLNFPEMLCCFVFCPFSKHQILCLYYASNQNILIFWF